MFSLSGNIITGIISAFNRIFDIRALDISNAIGETFRNLSKIMANVVPNITKVANQAMQMIMSLPEIPDYSESFDSSTIQHDFQDYQQDIENHSESSS